MGKLKKIKSVGQLKKICLAKGDELWVDCFILLNGYLRSSKTISFQDDVFVVINEIDDTTQELTEEDIMNDDLTNIGKAIKCGSFFLH